MSADLAAELLPVKPWDQRAKSVDSLAGGVTEYLETLRWIATECASQSVPKAELVDRYRLQYGISESNARFGLQGLRRGGILALENGGYVPTRTTRLWLESGAAELVAGMLHANVQFIGEMIAALERPLSKSALLEFANERYLLAWNSPGQIDVRAAWLRSAGLVEKTPDGLRATPSGVLFLEQVNIHEPPSTNPLATPRRPSDAISETEATSTGPPLTSSPTDGSSPSVHPPQARLSQGDSSTAPDAAATLRNAQPHHSSRDLAAEIGDRLVSLSCDGAKHKDFEVAVRDAFSFLGLGARQLSGAGQTDVLVRGVRNVGASGHADSASRSFIAIVEVKAVGNGRLTSNQVDLMTIKKHRSQHRADYALIVGPGPAGQLLDYARAENIGVLDSARLAEIVSAQDEVPLAAREYQRLFADAEGGPAGGEVDLRPLEEARKQHIRLRDLLRGVFRAVSEIDDNNAGTAIPAVVQFALTGQDLSASLAEVESTLQLLATPWLDALDLVDESAHQYIPTTTPHLLAQRLRWLADAFDETDGATATSSEFG